MNLKNRYRVYYIDKDGNVQMKSHHGSYDNAENWFSYLKKRGFCVWVQFRDEVVTGEKPHRKRKTRDI